MSELDPILAPVIVLVLWTCFVQGWMAITRLPYMNKAGIHPQKAERTSDLGALLPKEIQWKADNYNHLMEHPTIFYATAFVWAFIGSAGTINLTLAWVYVGMRVAHTLVHVTFNKVLVRFSLFAISSLALLVMAINAALILL